MTYVGKVGELVLPRTCCNITHTSTRGSLNLTFSFRFFCYEFNVSKHVKYSACFVVLSFKALTILMPIWGKVDYKLWHFPLCNFIRSPATSPPPPNSIYSSQHLQCVFFL
jgi:hypothetical protein